MNVTKYSSKVISIRWFTDKELMILVKLADDRGHALWDLEEKTGIAKSNLKPKIDSLLKKRAIYKGAVRKTRNKSSSHPNDTEQPYYIRPQRFFLVKKVLKDSLDATQSKLYRKCEKKQISPADEEEISKLREKFDLYRELLSDLETKLKFLRIVSPRDRIMGKYEEEKSEDSEFVPGALMQWSPSQSEIYKIAGEIEEYCTSPEAAVCASLIIRQDLYAAHNKWIEDHLPLLPKDWL